MSLKKGRFKADDLVLCDFQYEIRHTNVDCFKIGESVFLKCNPEVPMKVHSLNNQKVTCDHNGKLRDFPPECILQYDYSMFWVWKRKFFLCLN